jgi:hypothetical protein
MPANSKHDSMNNREKKSKSSSARDMRETKGKTKPSSGTQEHGEKPSGMKMDKR